MAPRMWSSESKPKDLEVLKCERADEVDLRHSTVTLAPDLGLHPSNVPPVPNGGFRPLIVIRVRHRPYCTDVKLYLYVIVGLS